MKLVASLTFLILIGSFHAFAGSRPEIVIPARVEVSQRNVLRLGDIAQVDQPTSELLSALDATLLPNKDVITASDISAAAKEEHILATFKIPSEVQIKRSASPISKSEVERRVVNVLKTRCHECDYKVNVQSAPFPVSQQWELDFSQLTAKGSFLIPVHDGEAQNLKWISGSVRVTKLTPVAARFIQSGERVQANDLKLASTDITFAKDSDVRIEDLQGQQLTHSVQVGQPIWSSDVRKEAAAKRGQILKATMGDTDYEISTNVEAQENGFVGDTIKVKNNDTQKILSALIVDKGVVKIQ